VRIIYKHQFVSQCPNNGLPIVYDLCIETDKMIQVEKIVTACGYLRNAYHEDIAKALANLFPGTHQSLRAMHHGVHIETVMSAE
jgi:hypothetical protein